MAQPRHGHNVKDHCTSWGIAALFITTTPQRALWDSGGKVQGSQRA